MLTKNYLKSLLLLLCIIVGAGTAWADGNPDVTYDFTESGWTVSGKTLTNGTVSFVGGPANAASFKMNSGYFMLGKKDAYINFPTYDKAVEKIVVTGRSGASASTKMNIYVGSTAVSTETTGSTGVNTYEIDSEYQAAGTQYTLKVTSAHNAQITKIEVYYKDPVNLTSFAFATTSPSVTLSKNGNNYEADYTQTVTVDPTDYKGDITYTIDEENSTFDTNDVIIVDNTGEIAISTTDNVGGTIVVKASGTATAAYNKPADATYTLTVNAAPVGVGTPTFSLATGAYYYGTTVEIEAVNSALITYTTDGTTPTMESTTYSTPVAITKTMTLKAKAWDNDLNESEVASIDYTLKAPEAPTFSTEGGEVVQGSTITLTPGEGGSVVVYTTDGSTPTIDSDIYSEPIPINAAMTIKAATVDDGDNLSAIASYDFTVKKAIIYEKVTDAESLAAGDKLLLVYEEGAKALSNINSGGKIYDGTDVTITDSKIADPSASVAVLTLGGTSAGWTLQSSLDGKYLMATNSNELRQNETATTDYEKWTITISDGVASVTNVGYNTRTIKYNASSPRFACYTSGQKSLALYRLQEDLEDATITILPAENFELNYGGTKVLTVTTTSDGDITATSSDETIATVAKTGENEYTVTAVNGTEEGADATITFTTAKTASYKAANASIVATVKENRDFAPISFAQAAVTADMEDSFTGQELTNANDLEVAWDSSDKEVATVANDGTVTLVAEGTTTISATFAGNATYKPTVAQYELTVTYVNRPGSVTNPYTVAKAIENTPASGISDNVYISGIVSAFYNTSIVGDGSNYRYYISDDGTTTDQLLVYKGKGLNEVAFSDASDLQIGDKVVIYGGLTTYNDAAEIASGNYIFSLTRKAEAELSFEKNAYEVRLGNDFDAPALSNPNNLSPITWESSDEAVATVDSEGAVTVKAEGTTTITATFAGNEDYKAGEASYELTVTNDKLDAGLELVDASISMNAATEKDITTLFTVTSDGVVTYESGNDEVAKVSEGKLVAVAPGETTITINVAAADDYKAATVDLPVTVTVYADVAAFDPTAKGGYVLVTDASTLQAGDNLILVNSNEDGGAYAMGAQNTNNRSQVEVTIDGGIIADVNNAQEIVLEGTADAWYLNVGEDSYLYAASNSSNHLKSANLETVGNNGKAVININGSASIVFQGTNSRNNLRYNAINSLFSCYASTSEMDEPYIYRHQSAGVTIGSTGWRTLVASANVKFPAGVTAYIVTAEDGNKAKLKAVKAVEANVPVLLKGEAGTYTLTVAENEECANTEANLLKVSEQNTCENVYVLANKSNGVGFYQWTGGWMGAGRVYLPVPVSGARGFLAFDEDGEATGISTIQNAEQGTKEIYNLNGQRVNQPAKGLYIVNGKKVFIK